MKSNTELARESAQALYDAGMLIGVSPNEVNEIEAVYAPAIEERDKALKELEAIRNTPAGEAYHVVACLQSAVADNAAILEALKENALIVRYPGATHCVLCDESGETEVNHGPRCPLAKDHPGQAILETLAERDRLLAEANTNYGLLKINRDHLQTLLTACETALAEANERLKESASKNEALGKKYTQAINRISQLSDCIYKRREEAKQHKRDHENIKAENMKLRQRIAALEEALRPFANREDGREKWMDQATVSIPMSQIRAAAKAMKGEGK